MAKEKDPRTTFSWFPKLTDVMREVACDFPERACEFMLAVMAYGNEGTEPEFDDVALKYAFLSVRGDIDNSLTARNGNSGGRPRKGSGRAQAKAEEKPGFRGFPEAETGVAGDSAVSETRETCETPSTVSKTKTGKSNTGNASESEDRCFSRPPASGFTVLGGAAPDEFEPPSAEEVRAYFQANCFMADPVEFFDHFSAQGWVRSNGQPVADWRALARMWAHRQREFDAGKPVEMRRPEAPIPKAVNAIDYEAELARLEAVV